MRGAATGVPGERWLRALARGGRRLKRRLWRLAGHAGLDRRIPLAVWGALGTARWAYAELRRVSVERWLTPVGNGAGRAPPELRTPRAVPELPAGLGSPEPPEELTAAFFRDHVLERVLPFWETRVPDREHGGYLRPLDPAGCQPDLEKKEAFFQGRILYTLSAGLRLGAPDRFRELAVQGARFLRERVWDHTRGGWFHTVTREGWPSAVTKHAVDQAFVLLGLAEHHLATGDPESRAAVVETLRLLDEAFWDGEHGGYRQEVSNYLRPLDESKSICVHLDLLGAYLTVAEFEPGLVRDRIRRLVDVVASRMVIRGDRTLEYFHRDWRYEPVRTLDRLRLGHCLECAWQLAAAARLLEDEGLVPLARRVVGFALDRGWDHRHGGFYDRLFSNGRLARRDKVWWTQTEGMSALLHLRAWREEPLLARRFEELCRFAFRVFPDRRHGEWCLTVDEAGRVLDARKRAGYRVVRACTHAHAFFRRREAEAGLRGRNAGAGVRRREAGGGTSDGAASASGAGVGDGVAP